MDILWERDPEGALIDVLERAVAQGRLDLLRDEDAVPVEVQEIAAELADLLDPDLPIPDPL